MAKFLLKKNPYLWNRILISLLYFNASSNYNAGLSLMQFLWLFKTKNYKFDSKFKWAYYMVYLKMQSQIQLNTINLKNCHHFWGWIISLPAASHVMRGSLNRHVHPSAQRDWLRWAPKCPHCPFNITAGNLCKWSTRTLHLYKSFLCLMGRGMEGPVNCKLYGTD